MKPVADMVITGARIETVDPSVGQVGGLATKDGRILSAGSEEEIRELIGPETIELHLPGRTVLPGFIDAHNHLVGSLSYGVTRFCTTDLSPPQVSSIAELVQTLKSKIGERSDDNWIVGTGYQMLELSERRHPTRHDLDKVSTSEPIYVCSFGGHIGVVKEEALSLVNARIKFSPEERMRALSLANREYLSYGITSAHVAGVRIPRDLRLLTRAVKEERLDVRVYAMPRFSPDKPVTENKLIRTGMCSGFGDDRLRIGSLKVILDGVGDSETAAVRHPYNSNPDNSGIMYFSPDQLRNGVVAAHKNEWQVAIHAIGDAAIEASIDAIEAAQRKYPEKKLRHRIEHCTLNVDDRLFSRIVQSEIIPVIQTPFITLANAQYREMLIRNGWLENSYRVRSFINSGVPVPNSSDAPVTSVDPLPGIESAVTRRSNSGVEINSEESVSLDEALRMYGIYGAYASFEEDIKGTLIPGKLADMAVLSNDIRSVPPQGISELSVDMTIVDGQIVYEN